MNFKVIFRPICWVVRHLWEMDSITGFYCERCLLTTPYVPKGWK